MMVIASLQVGQPRTYDGPEGSWTSAIAKHAVLGPVALGPEGLAGDAQADRRDHGGPQKAVLAYAAGHYPAWARDLGRELVPGGGFGENFTVAGADETSVAIGDQWRIGGAVLEISQPREPCRNPALYWREPGLEQRMRETGRTGWYMRVLTGGEVAAGAEIELVARPVADWTIARLNRVFYRQAPYDDPAAAQDAWRALAACELLSPGWRAHFARRKKRTD